MPDKDNKQLFGDSLQKVDTKLAQLGQERKSLAEKANKGSLSKKENKRFGELDDIIAQGNEYRSSFQGIPGQENANQPFEIDKKVVLGEGQNQNPSLVNPGISSLPSDLTGGADVTPLAGATMNTIQLGQEQGPGIIPQAAPIQTPVDPTDQIVSETIQGIKRNDNGIVPDVSKEINKATFGSPSGGYPPVSAPGEALATLDPTLSMGINDPILKGNVSGQIIGSQPIFVGGGDFTAYHAINNRKKAVQDAANKRAAEAEALINKKPPLVKDQRFQNSLNQQFYGNLNGMVDKAKEVYGENWDLALKDQSNPLGREFVQSTANFDFIAGQADQVTDLFGEIDADLESGDSVFSEETLQLRDEYNQLQNDFANGEIGGIVNLSDRFNKLKGFTNLDKIIKDNDIDTKGVLTQYASIVEDNDKYVTTTQKKKAYEDQVKVLAKGLADNQMRDAVRNGYITEDEIFDRLNARYGYENVIDKKITTKPAGSGIKVNIDLDNKFEGEKTEKVGGINYTVGQSYELPTGNKELEVSGLQYYDENGKLVQEDGIKNIDINAFQVVKVPGPNNTFEWKKVAVADVKTEKTVMKNGKPTTVEGVESKVYDLENLGPRVLTDFIDDPSNYNQMNQEMDSFINSNTNKTNTESALEYLTN